MNHPDATFKADFEPKNSGYKRWEFDIIKSKLKKEGAIKPKEKKTTEPPPPKLEPRRKYQIGDAIPLKKNQAKTLKCNYHDLKAARSAFRQASAYLEKAESNLYAAINAMFPGTEKYDIGIDAPDFSEVYVIGIKNPEDE